MAWTAATSSYEGLELMVYRSRDKWLFIALFLLPAMALYGGFVLLPYLEGIQKSFTSWSGFSGDAPFVGLGNYATLLGDDVFLKSVANNLILAAGTLPLVFAIALALAVSLNRTGRYVKVLRVVVVLPILLALPTVAALARQAYQPDWGFINYFLRAAGLEGLASPWLAQPGLALYAVAAAWIWYAASFYFIIFSAGLQNISPEVVEAARLDGAGPARLFWHITLPLLAPVLRVSVVFFIVGIFVFAFPLVHVMTQGGPSHQTEVMATWLYDQAFLQAKFGYASAIGVAVLVVSMTLAAVGAALIRNKAE